MQNRISYHILSLLHLNGTVKIPGLGRFRQAYRSAEINPDSECLVPPQTDSTFQSGEGMGGSLLEKYIAYRTDQSRTKARKEILRFAHEVQESLRNGHPAYLSYIGQLEPGPDDVKFDPETEFLNPGASLPEVGFVPREGFAFRPEPSSPVPQEPVSILPPLTFSTQEAEEIHTRNTQRESDKPEESQKAEPQAPSPAIAPVRPVQPMAVTRPKSVTMKEREWLGPVIALCLLAIIACAFLLFTGGSKRSQNRADQGSQTEIPTTGKERPVHETRQNDETKVVLADSGYKPDPATTPDTDMTSPETRSPEQDTAPGPSTQQPDETIRPPSATNKECLIVVGAFSLTLNADRMSRQLQQLGYDVRSVQNGKLAQVGVPVRCDDAELDQLRDHLRGTVEASAWILRPE